MNKNDLHIYKNRIDLTGFNVPFKIDVGCGDFPRAGYVGIDINECNPRQAICWDITKGIPLPNNWVNEIYTSHCLEHFDLIEIEYIFREFIRVAVSGCKLTILVPHGETYEGHYICHPSKLTEKDFIGWAKGYGGGVILNHVFRCSNNLDPFNSKDSNGMHLFGEFTIYKW